MTRVAVDWSMTESNFSEQQLSRFRRYLENQGMRESTIKGYLGNVERYLNFAKTAQPSMQDLEQFRDDLHNRNLSRSTKNQYNYAIKAYHAMIGEQIEVRRLEPNNLIPYYFDREDVTRIFGACRNLKHFAILQTLFFCCLRASELCNLDISDVDLKNSVLRIRDGKRGRDGMSYISKECNATLRRYLDIRPSLLIDGRDPLFFSDYGNRLHRTEIHRVFKDYKRKAGISKIGGVHVFARHTPASLLIMAGCDISIVQKILRHNDIRTTLRYTHISDQSQREAKEKFLVL